MLEAELVVKIDNLLFRLADSREALSWLRKTQRMPDIIMTDLNMPSIDGIEMVRQLRNFPGGDALSVIVFTTSNSRQDIRAAIEAGANDFLTKPISADQYFTVLLEILIPLDRG